MPGLLQRLLNRDAEPADAALPDPVAPPPDPAADAQPTREVAAIGPPPVLEAPAPAPAPAPESTSAPAATPLPPADVDPEAGMVAAPTWRHRSALRRRSRYLRRVRELGLRDLGGLVLDLHRFGRERPDLVAAKLASLTALENERRRLELALGTPRTIDLVREPGLASCPRCGALHPSEAHFCAHCGLDLSAEHAPMDVGAASPEPVPGAAAATVDSHGT